MGNHPEFGARLSVKALRCWGRKGYGVCWGARIVAESQTVRLRDVGRKWETLSVRREVQGAGETTGL